MKKYEIWLVPNGRMSDFDKGYTGQGWPDACKCWGMDLTKEECRKRILELAEENFRRPEGMWDDAFCIAEKAHLEENGATYDTASGELADEARTIGEQAADKALKTYLDEVVSDADPVHWGYWEEDLKKVRVRAIPLGTLYVCNEEGINAEPIDPFGLPHTYEESLSVEIGDSEYHLRETTGDDCLDAKIDFVAVNDDGEIGGYYQFRECSSIIWELNRGVWPVDACLRWNTREDMCIESKLTPNKYAHEIDNIKNDGAHGWDFSRLMSPYEVESAIEYIADNPPEEED